MNTETGRSWSTTSKRIRGKPTTFAPDRLEFPLSNHPERNPAKRAPISRASEQETLALACEVKLRARGAYLSIHGHHRKHAHTQREQAGIAGASGARGILTSGGGGDGGIGGPGGGEGAD